MKRILSEIDSTTKRKLSHTRPYFIVLFGIWVFLMLTHMILFGLFKEHTIGVLDYLYGSNFGISFSASFLEDLVIFLALGTVGFIISVLATTKTPEEYRYEDRVKSIMNSNNKNVQENTLLFKYLLENITLLTAFHSKLTLNIVLNDYDESQKAFLIYCETTSVLTNVSNDSSYKPPDSNAYVFPDLEVNGSYGYISRLETFDPLTNQVKQKIIDGNIYYLTSSGFEIELDLLLQKNGEIGLRNCYAIWNSANSKDHENSWYYFWAARYCQNVEISIENKLSSKKTVLVSMRTNKNNPKKDNILIESDLKLAYNEVKRLPLVLELYPQEKIEMHFGYEA